MLVQDVMTKGCTTCGAGDPVRKAAQLMASGDIGFVPVADGDRLVGMITDRDIVVRGVANGMDPSQAVVADFMTDKVLYCFDDQTCDEVATNMAEMQVRRLPVVDRQKQLIGIVSLGDLAARGAAAKAKKALEGVSQPA